MTSRSLSLFFAAVLLAIGAASSQQIAPRVALNVEPHVREAYEAAWKRLPDAWRQELKDVELHRAWTLGVPDDSPLSARLFDCAALAFFTNTKRRICVTEAGAKGEPQWRDDPPTRAEVASFLLDEIGFVVEGEGEQRVDAAWKEFVTKVYGWRNVSVPYPMPEVGDVDVLNRFLRFGVTRSLGADVPLEQLLFHELGHAMQNNLRRMEAHMIAWATLSGFRETDRNVPADGYSGGMFAMEQPIVLIRLMFDLPRGPATYAPAQTSQFVNRYGMYDLREDWAECSRLMAYNPEWLLRVLPMKFLYLNALGWSARLDVVNPGPLWFGGERLQAPELYDAMRAGVRQLLDDTDPAITPHPLAVAAILRAHADQLKADDLPDKQPLLTAPDDLPVELALRLSTERFTFVVEGERRQPPARAVRATWDEEVSRWINYREMGHELVEMLDYDKDELRTQYADEVIKSEGAVDREQRFEQLLLSAAGVVDDEHRSRWLRDEARYHEGARRPLVAMRYRLLAGDVDDETARAALAKAAPGFATTELAYTIARQSKRAADIEAVPGATWGAYRRVELFLATGRRDGALAVADKVALPELRNLLLQRVADALREAGDEAAADEVLDRRSR